MLQYSDANIELLHLQFKIIFGKIKDIEYETLKRLNRCIRKISSHISLIILSAIKMVKLTGMHEPISNCGI